MRNKRGFTLVELLIACGIALVILVTVGFVYVSSDRSLRFGREVVRSEADLRLAMDWLIRDIRKAESIGRAGNVVTVTLPSSNGPCIEIEYTWNDNQLTRAGDGSTRIVAHDITTFNIATNDTVDISLASLKPWFKEERMLTSKVTMRNAK